MDQKLEMKRKLADAYAKLTEGFVVPKTPYVLFGKLPYVTDMKVGDGEQKIDRVPKRFVLDCSGSHAHQEKILYYTAKGFSVLKYKLPVEEKPDPYKGLTNFGDDTNHFKDLALFIEQQMRSTDGRIHELQAELAEAKAREDVMAKKIADATAELAKRAPKKPEGDAK
jgi:hypothetical protein